MNQRRIAILLLCGGALLFFPGRLFILVLEISDLNADRLVACARMRPGEEFTLSYIHSVNRRPVFDTLRAERDHLVIVRSRFDSFGAGMPEQTTKEGKFRIAADGWLEWTVNRPLPEITVRVGRMADHKLHLKGKEIRLSDLAEPGTPLRMSMQRIRFFSYIKNRWML
ncbi:MAG: hypothetical protein A2V65_07585 [Deltaproteobacteria bacterium RBG_13_49_15]|nr:MAG: hypothetical protein A2V65_07585 [Deltaproteobacteria bacterium RBG_13_49_15]